MRRSFAALGACAYLMLTTQAAHAQADVKAIVVKHLTVSGDFTLKVAEQMPEGDYAFKLTPPQMSFAEQMAHLASDQVVLLAPFTNQKPVPSKPVSMSKKDVMTFVRQTYDTSIALVSSLTREQIERSYSGFGPPMTGVELLMFVLDHSTHHRAQAKMYLRVKGITPAEYEF